MNTQQDQLEKYSFLWSEARLLIAALALFLGGVPPLRLLLPGMFFINLVGVILTASWILSGLASVYLLYRWLTAGQKLFGGDNMKVKVFFLISVASGINLGIFGILNTNIGMSILAGRGVFAVTGLIYLYTAYHLYVHWNAYGKKVF